ncbi:MAG: helix-turn-helix domain-containing protein [Salinirussus sp.]
MYEATFQIDHDSPYASMTAQNDVTVEVWCNQYCDLLHVTGTDLDAPVSHVAGEVGVRDMVYKDEEVVLITEKCLLDSHDDDLLEEYLRRHNCLSLPPLTYDHGTLLTRVISLDESELTAVYRDVNETHHVTVEAKRGIESVVPDVPLLMLDSALPDLSPGQKEALLAAIEEGYYEIPRETKTAEVASDLGISRRTFEEHLRRAENKLVKSMFEYVAV